MFNPGSFNIDFSNPTVKTVSTNQQSKKITPKITPYNEFALLKDKPTHITNSISNESTNVDDTENLKRGRGRPPTKFVDNDIDDDKVKYPGRGRPRKDTLPSNKITEVGDGIPRKRGRKIKNINDWLEGLNDLEFNPT